MLRNYLRVALRNLLGNKGYTFLNILGMAIGIACCILTALYVLHELSYDDFLPDRQRTYRFVQTSLSPTKSEPYASVPFRVAPSLEQEYPEMVESTTRFYNMQEDSHTLRYAEEDISFVEEYFYFADSTALEFFDIGMAAGDARTALRDPQSVVLTREAARRYFGEEDPMGKTLSYKGVLDFTVTGVMETLPENSHLRLELLASFTTLPALFGGQPYDESWYANPVWTYVKLAEGVQREALESQLPNFADTYYHPNRPEGERVELALQPVTDIHLHSDRGEEMGPTGSWNYVLLFSGIALMVLVIACINFVNLATARSMERGREVGMRKVLGADRRTLLGQFVGESLLLTFLAVVLASVMVKAALPFFVDFVDKPLVFRPLADPAMLLGLLGITLLVGILSGLYPALYLSGFEPARILRGRGGGAESATLFRKGLVVFQFSVSVILIIGTVVIYQQLGHMQSRDMGYDTERVVVMPMSQTLIAWYYPKFRDLALQSPAVTGVAGSEYVLGADEEMFYMFTPSAADAAASGSGAAGGSNPALFVTFDFLDTYDISVIAGRGFSRDFSTDADQAVMVNRQMLQLMDADTPQEAVGAQFHLDSSVQERQTFTVIGVTENFNHTTLRKEVGPLVIRVVGEGEPIVRHIQYVAARLAPGRTQEGIEALRSAWEEVNHIDPFRYTFHEQELSQTYASERQMARLSGGLTLLAIVVACLGLFGLASYTTSLRTREIGLRKTLGASISQILALLSKDYLKLVLVANLIAWPVIWFAARDWLAQFPYRIDLGWNAAAIFLGAGLFSLLLCLLTVGWKSLQAALMNPVESIRQE
ncbi:MAG: ABC transporter permease [Balneolaceae bacterium]|nr:ABC transporter permease [Balneolaceae bacterium]